LKILELTGVYSRAYGVIVADVVGRFPIAVYNMLEIIWYVLWLCNITDIL